MYDRAAGVFPWREAWLAATFNHRILKLALTVLAGCIIAAATLEPSGALTRQPTTSA